VRRFKLSNDPRFVEKLRDVVGLYVDPPEHAIVLSVDEKSQIQALDRTQPGLPMKKGRAGTMTHDYKRPVSSADIPPGDRAKPDGTTTLFAALDILDGKVIGQCMLKHRSQELLRFLRRLNRETPAGLDLHLILDNYAAHKTPAVKRWVTRHPRCHLHFTPTSASPPPSPDGGRSAAGSIASCDRWANAVEGFFSQLTNQRLKRGAFRSILELHRAIHDYLAQHNADPKPFVWTKPVDKVIEKVAVAKQALESMH
jgi:hypothetical protein